MAARLRAVALHRDKSAFAELFSFYAPRVKSYLVRLGLDGAAAEEACQEVMVAVWRRADSFDPQQASVSTWIFRIARNRRIDLHRRAKTASAALDPEEPLLQPQPLIGADLQLEAAESEARVRGAMAELPEAQLRLIRASFYEGLSHSEIAESTGLALGTVKSRLRLALLKLRARLEQAL